MERTNDNNNVLTAFLSVKVRANRRRGKKSGTSDKRLAQENPPSGVGDGVPDGVFSGSGAPGGVAGSSAFP